MPKNKTRTAAAKRIRFTGTGKLAVTGSGMRHNLEHKSSKKRRALSRDGIVSKDQAKRMSHLLGR